MILLFVIQPPRPLNNPSSSTLKKISTTARTCGTTPTLNPSSEIKHSLSYHARRIEVA